MEKVGGAGREEGVGASLGEAGWVGWGVEAVCVGRLGDGARRGDGGETTPVLTRTTETGRAQAGMAYAHRSPSHGCQYRRRGGGGGWSTPARSIFGRCHLGHLQRELVVEARHLSLVILRVHSQRGPRAQRSDEHGRQGRAQYVTVSLRHGRLWRGSDCSAACAAHERDTGDTLRL